ncbi:succinyldiaminopimelate transaminase [Microbulbifer thermotolerans]|uniref:succinyldiaminopimelate transaminase n=1 Tax=Microbulbifer thermotolerans TaxID=252514 RepID=UPI0022493482|nr:succinyldiaminopimelate transaminase [Microbulbifer thermotolerans]MCX2793697.1 succinyldiaminopimelate transaminase [Microbulbifer thermotolerans]MCX2841134.1 succinyldiaminopimelate transaminase [Microbulbifer thermotolerans]
MYPNIDKLQPYPFTKLAALKKGLVPAEKQPIALSIGEPKHTPPVFVRDELIDNLDKLSAYPATKGIDPLRQAIAKWLCKRFQLEAVCADSQVLPVNGTREALFAFAQAVVSPGAKVLIPNPFYQIYEGAALLAAASPHFINCVAETDFKPDFASVPEQVWHDCELLYICTPGNPTGALLDEADLRQLIELADRYDFVIASDECYSELYFDEEQPPVGLLQVCQQLGRDDFSRCVVFHSLSKRSNLPGLRSGFVAGDAEILKKFLLYRTYHGCAMALPSQYASIAAWQDEQHVRHNRALYAQKFIQVLKILDGCLDVRQPQAGFYLWPKVGDGENFARELYRQQNITVLPGAFLAREAGGVNPGREYVRMALVATLDECVEAAKRIRAFCG